MPWGGSPCQQPRHAVEGGLDIFNPYMLFGLNSDCCCGVSLERVAQVMRRLRYMQLVLDWNNLYFKRKGTLDKSCLTVRLCYYRRLVTKSGQNTDGAYMEQERGCVVYSAYGGGAEQYLCVDNKHVVHQEGGRSNDF